MAIPEACFAGIRDSAGNDILHWAAKVGRLDLLNKFASKPHNLDPDREADDTHTALDLARGFTGNNAKELIEWADAWGTFLGRYRLQKGKPEHQSATCTVVFAEDVDALKGGEKGPRQVCIKAQVLLRARPPRDPASRSPCRLSRTRPRSCRSQDDARRPVPARDRVPQEARR